MARPRRATSDARYSGPPVKFKADWNRFEEALGCELKPTTRKRICKATRSYIEAKLLQLSSVARATALEKLDRLSQHISKVVGTWLSIEQDQIAATMLIEAIAPLRENGVERLTDTVSELGGISISLRTFLGNTKFQQERECFPLLVTQLAGALTEAGIQVGARKDFGDLQQISRFVRFVQCLNELLPQIVREHHSSPSAWATAISTALRKGRSRLREE